MMVNDYLSKLRDMFKSFLFASLLVFHSKTLFFRSRENLMTSLSRIIKRCDRQKNKTFDICDQQLIKNDNMFYVNTANRSGVTHSRKKKILFYAWDQARTCI